MITVGYGDIGPKSPGTFFLSFSYYFRGNFVCYWNRYSLLCNFCIFNELNWRYLEGIYSKRLRISRIDSEAKYIYGLKKSKSRIENKSQEIL